jgi:hypothetical protein
VTSVIAAPKSRTGGERRRWYVHVALMVSLAGSLLSLIYLSRSITIHVICGVAFIALMLVHLFQRRRTVKSLLKRLIGLQARARATTRMAISDIIFGLLALDVLISGVVDTVAHHSTQFALARVLHLPPGLDQWHKLAAFVFVVYAVVHVIRRRKRLRRSHIQ